MVASPVAENLRITSYKGEYCVRFGEDPQTLLQDVGLGEPHFIVDARVAELHRAVLRDVLAAPRTVVIEAIEENKSIEHIVTVMRTLVDHKLRRDHHLVAIGGGIIQDITCFLASTMLRGVRWKFVPTTLLAQADSCIGSKSSVNLGAVKNILGTFNPPEDIRVSGAFLDTLPERDIRSGIGEIIKVHAIDSAASFERLARDYERLTRERPVLLEYIQRSLEIKKRYIEQDEFDQGVRNIFNYGHSFGHAIESATDFRIPHGIGVTMGMAIANHIAARRGLLPQEHESRMRPILMRNARGFEEVPIPFEATLAALAKDKKNTSSKLVIILPVGPDAAIQKVAVDNDAAFREQLEAALEELHT